MKEMERIIRNLVTLGYQAKQGKVPLEIAIKYTLEQWEKAKLGDIKWQEHKNSSQK